MFTGRDPASIYTGFHVHRERSRLSIQRISCSQEEILSQYTGRDLVSISGLHRHVHMHAGFHIHVGSCTLTQKNIYFHVYMCVPECVYVFHLLTGICGGQKAPEPLNWDYRQ